jgi:stage V sporulation protein G
MEVTDVKVFPVNEERLKAFATITFDSCFIIRDVKIINGHNGLFIAMPSKRKKDGTYKDIAHPLNNDMRQKIEKKVIESYFEEMEETGKTEQEVEEKISIG